MQIGCHLWVVYLPALPFVAPTLGHTWPGGQHAPLFCADGTHRHHASMGRRCWTDFSRYLATKKMFQFFNQRPLDTHAQFAAALIRADESTALATSPPSDQMTVDLPTAIYLCGRAA